MIVSSKQVATFGCENDQNTGIVNIYTNFLVMTNNKWGTNTLPDQVVENVIWKKIDSNYGILTVDEGLKLGSKFVPICVAESIPKNKLKNSVVFNWEKKDIYDKSEGYFGTTYGLSADSNG